MKLLLLACGDIGARVINAIDRGAWQVAAMRRRAECLPDTVSAYCGDVTDREQLREVLLKVEPDVVIVTMTPVQMSDAGYRESYVKAAKNLCAVLGERQQPVSLIWVSSSAVYHQDGGQWVDEDSETRPESFRGKRLLEAEQALLESHLPVTIVRFSGIYGPGRERLLSNLLAGRFSAPDHPRWTNRIHSDDCAAVLLHLLALLERGDALHKVYLGSDSSPAIDVEMQRELARQLGVPVPHAEPCEVSIAGRRCSNRRLLESGFRFQYPSWREGYREVIKRVSLRSP